MMCTCAIFAFLIKGGKNVKAMGKQNKNYNN